MSKHFTFSLMGLVLIVFFAYVVMAGTPLARINHACSPIVWGGKAVTALADIASESAGNSTWRATAGTFQGCRFVAFRTFYANEYARLQAQAAAAKHAAAQSGRAPAAKPSDAGRVSTGGAKARHEARS